MLHNMHAWVLMACSACMHVSYRRVRTYLICRVQKPFNLLYDVVDWLHRTDMESALHIYAMASRLAAFFMEPGVACACDATMQSQVTCTYRAEPQSATL